MQHEISKKTGVLLLLILLVTAVACGSAASEPTTGNAATSGDVDAWLNSIESTDLTDLLDETDPEAVIENEEVSAPAAIAPADQNGAAGTAPAAEVVVSADQQFDVNGIPIGFLEDGHPYWGDPNAPVVIEEFSDFQCPFCARFASQTLPGLLENQIANGEVVLIYYDFPLSNIHPQADAAANAARCVSEQSIEAYWEFHELLFDRISEWAHSNPNSTFVEYGAQLGIDGESFQSCLDSNKYAEAVAADYNLGLSRGVSSTPSFFLNEQPLIGAQPLDTFNQAITLLLSGESIVREQAQPSEEEIALSIPTPAAIPLEADKIAYALGDPEASVTIVEYTDYQCPFCQRHSQETLPRIISEMVDNGRVYYVFKDFPLDSLHPDARAAAKAVRCGGEQDAYLEMHDAVFNTQTRWAGQSANIGELFADIAAEAGLDITAFNTCYLGNHIDGAVQANLEEGSNLGVTGTPAFFVNGYLMSGAQPFDTFDQVVALAENGELEAEIEASFRAAYAQRQAQQQPPPQPTGPVDVPLGDAFTIGDPAAPVTIVEYTDYQCPFCSRHFAQTYPIIKEKYIDTGLVQYVFKDFPLTSIHPQAFTAAEAARCAGEQDAYLPMHDILFANQGEWNGRSDAAAIFVDYAGNLGLDEAQFTECMETNRYGQAVQADLDEGLSFGIRGTPYFFLNGNPLVGAQPIGTFEQAIQQLQDQGTN